MAKRKVTRGAPPQIARTNGARRAGKATWGGSGKSKDSANFLGLYFREMAQLDVMTAEEEQRSAQNIAKLSRDYWGIILSYPPFVEGIAKLIAESVDEDDVPEVLLQESVKTARQLRDREIKSNRDGFDDARAALAEAMARLDVDGIVSDIIIADLRNLEAGERHHLRLQVTPARHGSRPFSDYVASVRRAESTLSLAKNAFVKANLRLVVSIARRFNHGRMPLQDLIQEGNIGLLKAVDRFDYRKGYRFSTYGSWWIRHAISRAIADKGREVRLPVHMIDAYHKVTKAKRELSMKLARDPSNEEVSEHTSIPLAKIEKMNGVVLDQGISLDRPVSSEDGRRVVDFLEDTDSEGPGERLETSTMNNEIRSLVAGLRPIEADILRKRFGLVDEREMTLKEIGGEYSLSRERIRQLQEQALGKIRRELKRREMM
jgi:RNA polymerase primary sigma factor